MSTIGVIGLGHFGTALSYHLARKGHQVKAWTRDTKIVNHINQHGKHPNIFANLELGTNINATSDINELNNLEVLLIVVASSALNDLLPKLKNFRTKIVISAIKGLSNTEGMTPLQSIRHHLPQDLNTTVLSGPGFAKDIVDNTPLGIVAAAESMETAEKVAKLFSGGCMRVYTSKDPLGVELGGILKNIIAIAAGIADGCKLGDSARAGVITRGLAEMIRLASAMGAQERTLFGLSGLGDLVLTATCDTSRNRQVGLSLGSGKSLAETIAQIGSVAEGVKTAALIIRLARKHQVEMPITEQVVKILEGDLSPEQALQELLNRPTVSEF